MAHANASERSQLLAGLRALADFLERSSEVPAPRWADVMVFPSISTDDEMRSEIGQIAALIGTEISDQTAGHGHYEAVRSFGPVQYRAVAILKHARERADARDSYARNIIVPGLDKGCAR